MSLKRAETSFWPLIVWLYINEYTNKKTMDLKQQIAFHKIYMKRSETCFYLLRYIIFITGGLFQVFWYLSDNFNLETWNSFLFSKHTYFCMVHLVTLGNILAIGSWRQIGSSSIRDTTCQPYLLNSQSGQEKQE